MYSTVLILRNIIYGAAARGVDIQKLCKTIGVSQADLQDAQRKVEGVEAIENLWNLILNETKDELIGLHLGTGNNISILGLIGYVIQNCATLKDAWDVFQKHQRMLSGWVSYESQVSQDEVHLYYSIDSLWIKTSPHTSWQGTDIGMAGLLNSLHILSGRKMLPKYVDLVRPQPSMPSAYENVYHCPVRFSRPNNRLVFTKEFLTTPVVTFDKSLYASFSKLLAEKANAIIEALTFIEVVKRCIMSDFKGQVPPVEVIASHLGQSSRSFQRKLESEGVSYRALSEEIKKDLAIALLRNPKNNVNEISKALGYTEPSAFRLAFKRWMNETPTGWRRHHLLK